MFFLKKISCSKVELATQTPGAEIHYTMDGTAPTKESPLYTTPLIIDEPSTIQTITVKGDLESAVRSFSYTVYDAAGGIQIHNIQGEGHWSPLEGSLVNEVEGIVTYKYQIRGSNYFHMQTPDDKADGNPNTSQGIVIYTGRTDNVEVGNLVNVTGKVSEYAIDGYGDKEKTDLPITQINARDDKGGIISIIENNVALPAPIEITSSELPGEIASPKGFEEFNSEKYAMDYWESIEGMRVIVDKSSSTSPQQHGDLVVTTDEYNPVDKDGNSLRTINGGVRLTEEGPDSRLINLSVQPNGPARDLKIKTGDKFTNKLEGVVNYGFGSYKIYTDLADVKAAHEEVVHEAPEEFIKDEAKLTVAAYNVENYSANSSAKETPEIKSQRIAKAFVEDMKSPDIISLIEVMANNGSESTGPEADKTYERLIADIQAQGGPRYDFVNIDPEFNQDGGKPSGNIRVGYLYNPERVDFDQFSAEGVDLKNDAVGYKNGQLTTNPGRVSPTVFKGTRKPLAAQFTFNGESVVVLNNHLNSKGGDVSEYGKIQPAIKGSEPRRVELAAEINRFVKEIKADNPDENVVVVGDMNDFEFSKPLQTLKGEELTNMIEKIPAEKRYSYVYNGNSQVLDHALVSNNIADKTEITVLNVNADYTDMHSRASDHNPLLVQVDLGEKLEIDEKAVAKVKAAIYNLPRASELTLEDEEDVKAVRAAYEALNADEKKLVTTLYNLEAREARLEELKEIQERRGWYKDGDQWYYYDNNGQVKTGWNRIKSSWYYMDDSGAMQTGWVELDGKKYYLADSGVMQTGWTKVDGEHYYMNYSGVVQTGWLLLGIDWYYMDDSGVMQTGWIELDGKKYYLDYEGVMQTGWNKIDGEWYYMNIKGVTKTGWLFSGFRWYYLNDEGVMQTGWVKVDGKRYYMNEKGVMQVGWTKIDGKWYYLRSSGIR